MSRTGEAPHIPRVADLAAAGSSRVELARAGMPDWAVIHRRLARGEVLARYRRQEIKTMVWTVNADQDLARWVAAPESMPS